MSRNIAVQIIVVDFIDMTEAEMAMGKDAILERAFEVLEEMASNRK